jgi:hypothetical protein
MDRSVASSRARTLSLNYDHDDGRPHQTRVRRDRCDRRTGQESAGKRAETGSRAEER